MVFMEGIFHHTIFHVQATCDSVAPQLKRRSTNIEKGVNELISLLLVTNAEQLNLTSFGKCEPPRTGRRASITLVQFKQFNQPGEKADLKRRQQKEELKEEARYLYHFFYQKTINSLVHATRSNLDALRRALSPPSTLSYGEPSNDKMDRQPVFRMQVTLAIPSIVVKPGLEEVQAAVCEAVQIMLAVHKKVPQWGPAQPAEPPPMPLGLTLAAASQVLAAASQQMATSEKKMEPRTLHKMVSENKEIAKLTTTLSSVITAAKKTVTESFEHFNSYQGLWVTEQETHLQEFMDGDPLLGDFEAKIRHYEQVEVEVMEETEQLRIGAFSLDTSERLLFSMIK